MTDQLFCHTGDIAKGLNLTDPISTDLFRYVEEASAWLTGTNGLNGRFIPFTETRRFDGPRDRRHLFIDPLLSVTTLIDDTTTLSSTDYLLYPRNRKWTNGPYTEIQIDPDASGVTAWTRERDIIAITGLWGKYNESVDTGVTLGANIAATTTATMTVSDASLIFPGMVLLIGTEQIIVDGVSDVTGAVFTIRRGVNGTTAATHTSADTINRYKPPGDVIYLCRQIAVLMHKKEEGGFAGKSGSDDLGEVFYHREFPKDVVKAVKLNYRIVSL